MFSVNPLTHKISIPKTDLTLISGTIYEMDTEAFREDLKAWEASFEGMVQTRTHDHNTEATIAGVTYARGVQIIDPYTVEFEDGQYTVILKNSNNNIFDVENAILVQNQVQVIPTNSAGLIKVTSGSGVTEQDKDDIADKVWDELLASHGNTGTFGEAISDLLSAGGALTPEQAQWLEDIFNATDKKLLTKALWLALK